MQDDFYSRCAIFIWIGSILMLIESISYRDKETSLEAYSARPDNQKRAVVILCHAWAGRDEFICEKAREISNFGYVGFALDMYGKGVLGKTKDEKVALKKPFENRQFLQSRALLGVKAARSLPYADPNRIAVVGFGFGGQCALDLARSGVPLLASVSIYGHFSPPPPSICHPIEAKILILHGFEDRAAPQEELLRFEKEMNDAKVDWQAHVYGNTMHAFASPEAQDPKSGLLYSPLSTRRAWIAIQNFLAEALANP